MTPFQQTINKLAKWRNVFAGWQLGTREKGDPECDAVRDHREATIMLRAELTSMITLLVEKKVFTHPEFVKKLTEEAELLSQDFEKKFPGMKASLDGIVYDERAIETMQHWIP